MWQPRWELRAFAIALGVGALLEVAVGVGLYLKTPPQTARLESQLSSEPARFFADEGARMTRVQRNFVLLGYGWITLVVAAATSAVAFKHRAAGSGVALALLLHGSFLLAFDLVAERRGAAYLTALKERS